MALKDESCVMLGEVLALPLFEKSKQLTALDESSRVVSSINVMLDHEIVKWVTHDGQMILTTGQVFEALSLEEQINLFRELGMRNVSALFIKIEPYMKALAPEVIEVCNTLKLPVVDLDYDVAFSEIFSVVYGMMFAKQTNVLRRVETLHKDMMNVVVSGGTLDDILKSVHKTIPLPIFIRDYYYEDTYFLKNEFADDYAVLYENIEGIQFEGKHAKLIWDLIPFKDQDIERLIIPIFVKNQVYGHMVTYGKGRPISSYDKLGLEGASNIVALEFLKKISVQEVENKYKVEFFDDLISLDEHRRSKAIERAGSFRFSDGAGYGVILVSVMSKQGPETSDKLLKAAYLTELICKDMGRPYLILTKGDNIVITVMLKEGETSSVVKRYTRYIHEILKNKMKKNQVKIGAGRFYKGLNQVYMSLIDAHKALDGAKNYLEEEVVFFEEMGIYKILSNSAIRSELELFYREVLEPLVLYDLKKDTELVKTLEVYFECNGNLKRMSEVLFTHYNTILYRLNRIQEIIQINLDDEESRFSVQTALKVHKIFKL
jgi:purine catabolism regulator